MCGSRRGCGSDTERPGKLRIKLTGYPDKKQKKDLVRLVKGVNETDRTHYGVPSDADLYCFYYDDLCRQAGAAALYKMGEKLGGLEVFEIAAFVRADARGHGIFRLMLDEFGEYLRNSVVRFAVYDGPDVRAVLDSIGEEHDHDELLLYADTDLFQGTGQEEKMSVVIDPEEGKVSTPFGECYYRSSAGQTYVFGVMTYANHRRKGYARKMLRQLFAILREEGTEQVCLQVSSENVPAMKLYEKLGMKEKDRLSYYSKVW